MLSPVAGSLPTTQTSAVSSATNLRAQLARFEAELANWENCPSCKTTEGKARIAEIAGKISDIKHRMEAAELSKQDVNGFRPNGNEAPKSLNDSAAPVDSVSPASGVGSLVNVYA
ncbi:hypothetical protein [Ferribacterium limneticum]|uniref:hypothetical protein n=1 Tax=Ferribacterium limneticum TaxID=76259 RepID=UPI001CF89DCE|nr:hypothetical protein [Ferribacterium limneticum]UCV21533.1 hypothetical protein KI613_13390 [Ferribacterium limneticum]